MTHLLVIRERLIRFYQDHARIVNALFRLLLSFITFFSINQLVGYNPVLKSWYVIVAFSVVNTVLPMSVLLFLAAAYFSCVLCIRFPCISHSADLSDRISDLSALFTGTRLCDPGSSDFVWTTSAISGANPSGADRCTGGCDPYELRGGLLLYDQVYYHGDRYRYRGKYGII